MNLELDKAPCVGFARPQKVGALLRLGPEPLSVYWSNPSKGVFAAGLGVAAEGGGSVRWLSPAPSSAPPGMWFGGWAFDAQAAWTGFDSERWILPEVLAWWDGQQSWVAAFGSAGVSQSALTARLDALSEVEPATGEVSSTAHAGSKVDWCRLVDLALSHIDAGAFQKVVLARSIAVQTQSPWRERSILKKLEVSHPQCWTFLVRGRDGRAFVGSTPEVLCEAHHRVFFTDALAGTAPKGKAHMLLQSRKDLDEHRIVVESICAALAPHAVELDCPSTPSIKTLTAVEHLHTSIRAQLKAGVSPLALAKALHPTPAVGGYPRRAALEWLSTHEGWPRGWYAGAVGTRQGDTITLAVALRSALLSATHAEVFVGAGIVFGSEAEAEWRETERKASTMLHALGAST